MKYDTFPTYEMMECAQAPPIQPKPSQANTAKALTLSASIR